MTKKYPDRSAEQSADKHPAAPAPAPQNCATPPSAPAPSSPAQNTPPRRGGWSDAFFLGAAAATAVAVTDLLADAHAAPLKDCIDDSANAHDGVLGGITSRLNGLVDPTTLVGIGGTIPIDKAIAPDGPPLAAAIDVANTAVDEFHLLLEGGSHATPLTSDVVHAVTGEGEFIGFGNINEPLGAKPTDLLTEIANAPSDIVNGKSVNAAVGEIVDEFHATLAQTSGSIGQIIESINLANPLGTGVLPAAINNIAGGGLLAIGEPGNALTGTVGSALGSGALVDLGLFGKNDGPSNFLIDVDAGEANDNGLVVDLLWTTRTTDGHTLDVNVLEVGNAPKLLDVELLTDGEHFQFGDLGNSIAHASLVDDLLASTHSASTQHHLLPFA